MLLLSPFTSNGSIIHMTDINVPFNTTFPNDAQIVATLTRAALSGNLSITITFINGTGRQMCYSSTQGLIIEGETVQQVCGLNSKSKISWFGMIKMVNFIVSVVEEMEQHYQMYF